MYLYAVSVDGETDFVQAENIADALIKWQVYNDGTNDEPTQVTLICDYESIIR